MIEGLRPYADMVATGLPWLPSLPAHWDLRRNGRLFGERRETGYPDLPVLEVSIRTGVRIRDFEGGTRKQEIADRSKYQRAVHGDIAYNMMRMWQGAVGIAPADGLVSPAYVVAKPFAGVEAAYYAYLFRTDGYKHEIDAFSRGIVPDRNRLYWEAFKQMPSAYPPLEEQRLIVRFLDWHGGMTARLIRAKKRLIALLNEQKQSIIHHAVTRGLDPAAPLKPSGVDWLGDVPEGWEVKRLKWVAHNVVDQTDHCPSDQIYVALEDIESWIGRLLRTGHSDIKGAQLKKFLPSDVLFGKLRPYLAKVIRPQVSGVCVGELLVLRADAAAIDPAFLEVRLRASDFIAHVNQSTFGAKMPRADWGFIGGTPIAYPPNLSEQHEILQHIQSVTRELADLSRRIGNEITLIQEFRNRLIADVVTGQLDVRALAATLPAVTEAAPLDELTDSDETDEDANALEDEEAEA